MVGRKVAPWGVAAGIAGGYLLLVIAAQWIFLGASRPRAFVISLAAALLLSGVLLAMGMSRREKQALQSARLAVIDVAPDGGAWQHDSVAFVGMDDPAMELRASDERVMMRPALADVRNRPGVRQQPFVAEAAGVYPDRVERVWEASGPANANLRLEVIARFGPGGMRLEVDNGLGRPLEAPLLVFNRRALSLANLPAGPTSVTSMQLNEREDFTSSIAMLTSELAKRRGQVVQASLTSPDEMASSIYAQGTEPLLIGWLDDPADAGLIRPSISQKPGDRKAMVMVRGVVRIEPPAPGTKLVIPASMVSVQPVKLPYERRMGETVPSQEQGSWLIGFSPPAQLGQVRPTRATLSVRVNLPAHTLSFHKGACREGKPVMSLGGGAAIANWSGEVGARVVSFECSPEDYDAAGRVWLLMQVEAKAPSTGGSSGASGSWQIKDLSMSMNADAVAPPPPVALDPLPGSDN
jgi:hypothetical protein